ncbi:MAG: hypothetical protein GY851_07930, partial [bacterium]|nr:hypothetical protein [bacterium]
LVLSLVITGIVWAFSSVIARGVLAGGLGGTLAFWIIAYRAEKLAIAGKNAVKSIKFGGTAFRLGLYAVVLWWGFSLDPETSHGLIGAACGLFIAHLAVVIMGLTGLDLKAEERSADGSHR